MCECCCDVSRLGLPEGKEKWQGPDDEVPLGHAEGGGRGRGCQLLQDRLVDVLLVAGGVVM